MSYLVMARKWRPQRFSEVVGQEHIATTILNSIRSGRTAHAYLFVGPRGIGKTSTARIFAKAMNCPDSNGGEPCGECDACREIAEGSSIDVIEIDGASNNSVDDVRQLRENVKLAPARLSYKVYVIDEVHMLSTAAFNAFLKTLEEPPTHVKFILATTEAHKIPMTVLSRCQRFDFRRLTSRQIAQRLQQIVDAEGIAVEEGALFAVARAAEGSMRDGQSILDQLVSFSMDEIKLSDVHAMLGTVGLDVYRQLAEAIAEGDSLSILKTIDDILERGKDLAQFVKDLTVYFRNLFIASQGGGAGLIDLPEEDLPALKEICARFKQPDLIRIVQDLTELESRFRQLPSPRVAFEMLLLRMSQVGADVSIDNLLSRLTTMEKRLKGSGAMPADSGGGQTSLHVHEPVSADSYGEDSGSIPKQKTDPPADEPQTESGGAEDADAPQMDLWRQFLDEVRDQSMSIYSFLNRGRFCGLEDGQLTIGFDEDCKYNKTHLEKKDIKKLLEETLKGIVDKSIKIKLIIEKGGPRNDSPPKKEVRREEDPAAEQLKREKAAENPAVKKVLELFKGRIVYVSG